MTVGMLQSVFSITKRPPSAEGRRIVGPTLRASLHCILALVVLAIAASRSIAELPAITLATITPAGAQAGTEVEVAITGADLDDAKALHFSNAGLTATLKTPNHFAVKIAPGLPVGVYDVRVSGRLGVSNPRAFVVGDLAEIVKGKAHDKQESAVELPIGHIFNGTTTAAVSDFFKFSAKKGERVLIECAGREIDSRISPVISVLDSAGKELESSRRGGLLDFTAQADATLFIQLHDLTYAGGPEYFYRLKLSKGPRLDFIFPPSGQAGTKGRFTLYGRGLPGGTPANIMATDRKPLEKLDVEIELPPESNSAGDSNYKAGSITADGFSYRLKTSGGTSNPIFISFATSTVSTEKEPNNKPGEAQKLSIPCEVAGQFYPAADIDCYAFDAKKGDVYWIEVFSNRTGIATSPFLLIQRDAADIAEVYASDADPGGKKFTALSNDPAWRFDVKEDGTYRVQVRDLFGGTRSNPASTYRLSIRREAPDFRLTAIVEHPLSKKDDRTAAPRGLLLMGGQTIAIKVIAFRRDNFTGDIELTAEGLPAGVKCVPSKIEPGKNDGMLLLTADEKIAPAVSAIHIIGKGKAGDRELQHEARGGAVVWTVADFNVDAVTSRLTGDFMLAVNGAEPAPISIEPTEDKVWEAPAGGKIEIPLRITRRGEFKEALKLKAAGTASIDALKEIDVDPKATTATAMIDLKTVKIPAGIHTIYLSAQTKGKYAKKDTTITVYSAPIRIAVQ